MLLLNIVGSHDGVQRVTSLDISLIVSKLCGFSNCWLHDWSHKTLGHGYLFKAGMVEKREKAGSPKYGKR